MSSTTNRTYEDYAIEAGIPVSEVKRAVHKLFSDHRKEAMKHDHVNTGRARLLVGVQKCGVPSSVGKPCAYKALYSDGKGGMVCGLHRPEGYNMNKKNGKTT